jgi:hypothetical protein
LSLFNPLTLFTHNINQNIEFKLSFSTLSLQYK